MIDLSIDNIKSLNEIQSHLNDAKELINDLKIENVFSDCDLLETASEDIDVIENNIDNKYDLVNYTLKIIVYSSVDKLFTINVLSYQY